MIIWIISNGICNVYIYTHTSIYIRTFEELIFKINKIFNSNTKISIDQFIKLLATEVCIRWNDIYNLYKYNTISNTIQYNNYTIQIQNSLFLLLY